MNKTHIDSELYEILHFTPEASSEVQDKVDNAYGQIRHGEVQIHKKRKPHSVLYPGAAAAAVILLLGFLGFSNPVLAGKIPFIGRIFQTIEESVGYSGNYSAHATTIAAPDTNPEDSDASQAYANANENPDSEKEADSAINAYSQTSGGITITLSEVTCTDLALYIALEIYNEEGFPDDFNMKKNREGYILSYNFLHMYCSNSFDFAKTDELPTPNFVEGDYTDSNTFLGILRVDLESVRKALDMDVLPPEFIYSVQISGFWGMLNEPQERLMTNKETGETRTIMSDHKSYDGLWDFTVPVTVDKDGMQVKEIMETNEDGIGISKVTKTRYEIFAEIILPDGEEPWEYIVIITDADGNILDTQGDIAEVYSVYGRNTDTVNIYVMDMMSYWNRDWNAQLLSEQAVFQTTVTW